MKLGWKTCLDPRDLTERIVRKTVPNGGSSRKDTTPISSGWFPRQNGRAEFTPDPIERNSNPFLQNISSLRCCGFLENAYSKLKSDLSPLYQVTLKKNEALTNTKPLNKLS